MGYHHMLLRSFHLLSQASFQLAKRHAQFPIVLLEGHILFGRQGFLEPFLPRGQRSSRFDQRYPFPLVKGRGQPWPCRILGEEPYITLISCEFLDPLLR